jgi:hypothetical protein
MSRISNKITHYVAQIIFLQLFSKSKYVHSLGGTKYVQALISCYAYRCEAAYI